MRLIGQLTEKKEASSFCAFLNKEEIASSYYEKRGYFEIWVNDEDHLEKALHWLKEFKKDPADVRFQVQEHPIDNLGVQEKSVKNNHFFQKKFSFRSQGAPITSALLLICIFAFLIPYIGLISKDFLFKLFAYDLPTTVPFWEGFYDIALKWPNIHGYFHGIKLFEKIREGELWRLFTPCFLHGSVLHILFNMLWLWTLGRQVEERIKRWQYLLITLLIGVVSNTFQYLISGPLFLGYSGIICGLVGFIWMRQRLAPWEGYPLQEGTTTFLAIFVVGMVVLQMVSFFLDRFKDISFPLDIANGAHVVGALTGIVLGSLFKK